MPSRRIKLEFPGYDQHALAGSLELPDAAPVAFALFAHCFTCGKDIAAASRISRSLVKQGYAVLRFDFTGLGGSDGDFANTNFSSNVQDILQAATYLRNHYQAPQLLIGHSLGGAAVLLAASKIPECCGVVTIGAPATPDHVAKQFAGAEPEIERKGVANVDLAGRNFTIQKQFLEDIRQIQDPDYIATLRVALLVFHSPIDNTVDISEAEKIYRAAKHPKSFVSLDKADHLLSSAADSEYVASTIAAWAGRYVGAADVVQKREPVAGENLVKGEVLVNEQNHRFTREVSSDSHRWLADEPTSLGGDDLGPDPYEHLLAALGTCTSMTIRMYANRKKIPLDDVKVKLRHQRVHREDCEGCDEKPLQISQLDRELSFKGALTDEQTERLLEIADKCPVHRTLEGQIAITKILT